MGRHEFSSVGGINGRCGHPRIGGPNSYPYQRARRSFVDHDGDGYYQPYGLGTLPQIRG